MRPIFYDVETTGTKPQKHRVVEIAAFDVERKQTFCSFVYPECEIPVAATAIHHITDEMVKGSDTFEKVGPAFFKFCSGDVVLIAHNNDAFDQLFLEEECRRFHLSAPSWSYIDSYRFARRYRSDLPKHSLQYLRQYYQIEENQAHRALDDVMTLSQVFDELVDDLTLDRILGLMKEEKELCYMPFGKYKGRRFQDVPSGYYAWLHKSGVLDRPDHRLLKKTLSSHGLIQDDLQHLAATANRLPTAS